MYLRFEFERREYEKSSIGSISELTNNANAGFRRGADCVSANDQRHKRTFWQKHRDKLTVGGAGLAGAGIGGLTGGRKGAAIGTAVGAGSGAVYTYGIRKRHRRHYRRY